MPLSSATWSSGWPASAVISRPSMTTFTGFLKVPGAPSASIIRVDPHRAGDDLARLALREVERLLTAVDVLDRMPGPLARDALLQLQQTVDHRLGSRRAARHVDVDRDDGVDALDDGVVVVRAAGVGAVAERHDPLRIGHLLP